jgi:hypothetical protein
MFDLQFTHMRDGKRIEKLIVIATFGEGSFGISKRDDPEEKWT